MNLEPKDLYQKLEFDKVLEITEAYCFGDLGRTVIQNLTLMQDASLIERKLQEVFEYTRTYEHSHRFPISRYHCVDEELKMLGIEGYVLSIDGFRNIADILLQTQRIFAFFNNKEKREIYPTLHSIVKNVQLDLELLKEIKRVIDEDGNIRPDASSELQYIARMQSSKRQELAKKFRSIAVHYQGMGKLAENVESFRNGRRVLAVPVEYKRQVRGIIHDESSSGRTVFIEPEGVIDINNDIFELEREYQREIYRILKGLSDMLRPYINDLKQFQDIITRFDVIQAKGQLAWSMQGQKPKLYSQPHFKLSSAVHPLLYLKNNKEGNKTVPFDLHFRKENRILVLSGPNAGGKSITMKTVGLLQMMVQAGMLLPVEEGSEIGIFKQIFADIGDQQSLEDELSTYSSRLQNARVFMQKADADTLVLIDEFGSGTDPKMGGAIAEAILKELNFRKVYGVITTHYSNLKSYAFEHKGLVNGSMIFNQETLSPTYKMRIGKPGSSYAFEIATKSGLPKKVIAYARRQVGVTQHNFEEMLSDLQKEKEKTQKAQEQLKAQEKRLDSLIKNYEHAHRELEFGRKKLRLEIKEQELQDLHKGHRELQKLMRELKEEGNKEEAVAKAQKVIKKTFEQRRQKSKKVAEIQQDIYKIYEKEVEGTIEVGSHVRMREGGMKGIVTEIKRKEATIQTDTLSMRLKLADLVLIKDHLEVQKGPSVKTDIVKKTQLFESSLDIRGMRYEEALEMLQDFMDTALMENVPAVHIIHGKGTGALRKVVKRKLKEYPNINRIYHPEPHKGGDGKTIVEFT